MMSIKKVAFFALGMSRAIVRELTDDVLEALLDDGRLTPDEIIDISSKVANIVVEYLSEESNEE